MDACNLEFAREMVAAFGEDRFYHAVVRPTSRSWPGSPRPAGRVEARVIFLALGGSKDQWESKCRELKLLSNEKMIGYKEEDMDEEEARKVLCRTACMLAKHYKEYALKGPEMPPSVHARMTLDSRNEWTENYVDILKDFER